MNPTFVILNLIQNPRIDGLLGIGFGVLGYGCWVRKVLGIGYWVLGFRFLGVWFW